MTSKDKTAKPGRVLRLIKAFRATEAEMNAAWSKREKIESKNEEDLFRAPRVLIGRFVRIAGDQKSTADFAYSHKEIDEKRQRYCDAVLMSGAGKEAYDSQTRSLHAQFDGDIQMQQMMRKHIGWSEAEEAINAAKGKEQAIVAKLLALQPQSASEYRDKVAVVLKLSNEGVPGIDDDVALKILVADAARLFGKPAAELIAEPDTDEGEE